MNHLLSLYSIINLAIIFSALSMFGSNLLKLDGAYFLFAMSLLFFIYKVSIDDYVHFIQQPNLLRFDLIASPISILLLVISLYYISEKILIASLVVLIFYFLFCKMWIIIRLAKSKDSNKIWILWNSIYVILLIIFIIKKHVINEYAAAIFLFCLFILDFCFLGTFKRLSKLLSG